MSLILVGAQAALCGLLGAESAGGEGSMTHQGVRGTDAPLSGTQGGPAASQDADCLGQA